MAWIEQTKKASGKSGGPQYYLQDLNEHNLATLRRFSRRPVRLWTPYGVVDSGLEAVSSAVGSVGHDRVHSGRKAPSIADQIAHWFNLNRADIEHLEFDDSFDDDSFVVRPTYVKFFGRKGRKNLYPDSHPLSLTARHRSPLLTSHLRASKIAKEWLAWASDQIGGMIEEHAKGPADVDERDLLRSSGALDLLGIKLGIYRRIGIDCPDGKFQFEDYPEYPCQIEIEEKSSGFLAPHHASHRRQRVVLLCMVDDAPQVLRGYVDVLELRELGRVLQGVA